MTGKPALYSVWLIPNEPHLSELQALVTEFAQANSSPTFVPHMTMIGDLMIEQKTLAHVLSQHTLCLPALELTVTGITLGDSFFKSFYLGLSCPTELSTAQSALTRALPSSTNPGHFDPHISLAYGAVGNRAKLKEHLAIENLIGRTLRFERMQLVRSSQSIPVVDWEVLEEFDLPGI